MLNEINLQQSCNQTSNQTRNKIPSDADFATDIISLLHNVFAAPSYQVFIGNNNKTSASYEKTTENVSNHNLAHDIKILNEFLTKTDTKSCVIYSEDCVFFTTALLASIFLGLDVIIPANNKINYLIENFGDLENNCFLGDFEDLKNTEKFKKKHIFLPEKLNPEQNKFNLDNKLLSQDNEQFNSKSNNSLDNKSNITIFTSGTTGKPKAIKKTLTQLANEIALLSKFFKEQQLVSKQTVFIATVTHQHLYGLTFKILLPLLNKLPIYRHKITFEESLYKIAQQHDELILISSQAFLKRLTIDFANSEQKSAKFKVLSSGGMLTEEQGQQIKKIFMGEFLQIYGSSETGVIAYKYQTDAQINAHTKPLRWQFFPNVTHKTIAGTLHIKSAFAYHANWHNTNDLVQRYPDGFELLGRADMIVKIEEKRVSLLDIERQINKSIYISESIALACHQNRDFIAIAVVLTDEGLHFLQNNPEKTLKEKLKNHLANYFEASLLPRKIRIISTIDYDSQGKVKRDKLKELFK